MLENLLGHCVRRRARGHLPLSLGMGLCALICIAGSAAAAVRVQVLNLSPRDSATGGTVSIDLGGQAEVGELRYKSLSGFIDLANPNFRVNVRDETGGLLHSETVELPDGRDHILALIGNGQGRPFKIYQDMQHADFTPDGKFTLQLTYLAALGSFNDPVFRYNYASSCADAAPPTYPRTQTTPFDDLFGYVGAEPNLHALPAATCIRVDQYGQHVFGERVQRNAVELTAQPGERIRVIAVGDGVNQPVEQLVIRYGTETTRPFVDADLRMDGLWFDPELPGHGLAILIEPGDPARVRMLDYGFDRAGINVWRASQNTSIDRTHQFSTFSGGTPDGQSPTRSDNAGGISLRFHSCNEASYMGNTSGVRMAPGDYGRPRLLFKLLPLDNCLEGATP